MMERELTIGKNHYHDERNKTVVISLESFDKKDILTSGKRSCLRSKDFNH